MSILEKVSTNIDAVAVEGEIPIQSRYTYGLAGEKFFREIMDNARLLGTRCEDCERCFAKLEDWEEVGPEGTVESFTVLLEDLDGSPLADMEIMALIQLDGADSVLVHRLGDVSLDDLAIGMRVTAVFKPPKEREGSILDIVHFAPVEA
jgi:uncharacterized OB-fold protein